MAYVTIQGSLLDERPETIIMRTQEVPKQNVSTPWGLVDCAEYCVSVGVRNMVVHHCQ